MFSRQLVTLAMLWQKTARASQERLIITDSCHQSPFVIICGSSCHQGASTYTEQKPAIRENKTWLQSMVFVSWTCIILSNPLDFYWGQDPLIWGRKQVCLHKSGMPCICMGSQPIEARPNVAKFEGRWPKSVHNAGSNLGNGGTKWGIMLGKVPHTSWTGAHGRPRYPGKVWTESKQERELSCHPDSPYRGFLNFYVWFSSHICDVLSSLASLLAQLL